MGPPSTLARSTDAFQRPQRNSEDPQSTVGQPMPVRVLSGQTSFVRSRVKSIHRFDDRPAPETWLKNGPRRAFVITKWPSAGAAPEPAERLRNSAVFGFARGPHQESRRSWARSARSAPMAPKSIRILWVFAPGIDGLMLPHRRVIRSRNSLRARNSRDFAAGTVIPKRWATSIMGSPSISRSSSTRLKSGGMRRISVCKISCISR